MNNLYLQKLALAAIDSFLTVSCSKGDMPATKAANLTEITIGTQVWPNKNLDVATYSDGTATSQVTRRISLGQY